MDFTTMSDAELIAATAQLEACPNVKLVRCCDCGDWVEVDSHVKKKRCPRCEADFSGYYQEKQRIYRWQSKTHGSIPHGHIVGWRHD